MKNYVEKFRAFSEAVGFRKIPDSPPLYFFICSSYFFIIPSYFIIFPSYFFIYPSYFRIPEDMKWARVFIGRKHRICPSPKAYIEGKNSGAFPSPGVYYTVGGIPSYWRETRLPFRYWGPSPELCPRPHKISPPPPAARPEFFSVLRPIYLSYFLHIFHIFLHNSSFYLHISSLFLHISSYFPIFLHFS